MSTLNRGPRAATRSRTDQVWPAVIALIAVVVFFVFLMQATPALALTMTLATLVAGGLILTLVCGTAWLTQLRQFLADLRG